MCRHKEERRYQLMLKQEPPVRWGCTHVFGHACHTYTPSARVVFDCTLTASNVPLRADNAYIPIARVMLAYSLAPVDVPLCADIITIAIDDHGRWVRLHHPLCGRPKADNCGDGSRRSVGTRGKSVVMNVKASAIRTIGVCSCLPVAHTERVRRGTS